jgi:hypothetical protein
MVHDPALSLRTGDVISISSGWRVSKNVHHVVRSILAPFGEPIEARPPVPTEEERMAERVAKSNAKMARKKAREAELLASKSSFTPEELRAIEEKRSKKDESPQAGVKRGKVAKVPVPQPSPEELQMFKQRRQQKREERARLYRERTGATMPDWQIFGWMNAKEREEWQNKNPQTWEEAKQTWLSKHENRPTQQTS